MAPWVRFELTTRAPAKGVNGKPFRGFESLRVPQLHGREIN